MTLISHSILLDKMAHYGLRGIVLDWFKNYLTNRKQFVEYNNHASATKQLSSGMPQGSILGPLGFIIYVNDIPNAVPDLSLILYADDTSAFTSHENIQTLNNTINTGLTQLNTWFNTNKLSLNHKKTNYMLFGTRYKTKQCNNNFKVSLDDKEIDHVNAFKFLGVSVDQNLTWKNHIDNLVKKCSSGIGMLYKVKRFLPETALLRLYDTLVLSHINYGITAWSSANNNDRERLHILQKRALRAVSNSEFRSPSNPLFVKYNHLKVVDLCKYNIGTFMYKFCNDILPSTFNNMFTTNADNHNYDTRHASDFEYPNTRLEFGSKSIGYQGVKIWNNIPMHVKNSKNLNSFKHSYKEILISEYEQLN